MNDAIFMELVTKLGSEEASEQQYAEILERIKADICTMPEIRIYVDGSPNFGHQSSTITLMRQLIDWSGYANQITIFYVDTGAGEIEAQNKLALLLPGLDAKILAQDPGSVKLSYHTCQNIRFAKMDKRLNVTPAPTNYVKLGITGGSDVEPIFHTPLKAEYFVRLEPYLWSHENRIEIFPEGAEAPVKVTLEADSAKLIKKALYHYNQEMLAKPDPSIWNWYIKEFQLYDCRGTSITPNPVRTQVFRQRMIWAYELAQRRKDAIFWPMYGFQNYRHNCEALGGFTVPYDITGEILFNLVLSGLFCRPSRPVAILLFNTVKTLEQDPRDFDLVDEEFFSYVRAFEEGEEALHKVFEQNDVLAELSSRAIEGYKKKLNTSHTPGVVEDDAISLRRRLEADGAKRISRIHILNHLGETALEAGHIYIVKVGSLPMDLFNHFFCQADMPPFFEGQGTSSLALNTGRPFIQCSLEDAFTYPSRKFAMARETFADNIYQMIRQLVKRYMLWDKAGSYQLLIDSMVNFIQCSYDPTKEEFKYFQGLKEVYLKPQHNKLFLGLIKMYFYYKNKLLDPVSLLRRQKAGSNGIRVLEDVYEALLAALASGPGELDLLQALPGTRFASYYNAVTGGSLLATVNQEDLEAEAGPDGRIQKVTIRNGMVFLLNTTFSFSLTFTYEAYTCAILSVLSCGSGEDWSLPGIPWIRLERLGFLARIAEGDLPAEGEITGILKGTGLAVSMAYPIQEGVVLVRGEFPKPVSALEPFYQIAGGVNFVKAMPKALQEVGGFGLKSLCFAYQIADTSILSMEFSLETDRPWTFMRDPDFLFAPQIDVMIISPQDVLGRAVSFRIGGQFTIGEGVINVAAYFPDFRVMAALIEHEIDLNTFVELFGGNIDLKSSITAFQLDLWPDKSRYLLDVGIRSDWNLFDLFTFTGLSLHVSHVPDSTSLSLTGDMTLLPQTAGMNLHLQGSYQTDTGSWQFLARQSGGGVLQIAELILSYLGWEAGEHNLPVAGMELMLDSAAGSWQIMAATQEGFSIPFLDGVTLMAQLAFGSKKDDQGKDAFYALISAQFQWKGVDLTFWYNYHPDVQCMGFTWNQLQAVITRNQAGEWIGTVSLLPGMTLGSMIETMVSWLTGNQFGLEAPWSLLNEISLSGLMLSYNFTAGKVAFAAGVGEVDLGFAKINGIEVSYEPENSQGGRGGVMVSLIGEFLWNVGGSALGDAHSLGPWDTSMPGQAPSPSGTGNKYFDLDMLALGQHVTYDGFSSVVHVQDAIRLMKALSEEDAPVNHYDPQSSWLIGADIKILKLTGEGENGYLLRVQTVFNDPVLYALRVVLAGEAAKALKGLDFQILYKKLNDHLGVFQAEITLPDAIRYINLGGLSITLPVIGAAIYTNGDFQIDIGFPWNQDFSRSFSIEALVYPGIPLIGSGGFYFGMLSGETCSRVPVSTRGVFNPVLVFGLGLQVGLGKSLDCGILQAGFSITVFGILEGIIAKWNPYLPSASSDDSHELDSSYYYCVQGTVGVIGKLYGSVDFCIIKASVNVCVSLMLNFLVEAYRPIKLSVECSVNVSLSVFINLGLFKIKIHLSFHIKVKQGFEIETKGQAPWGDSLPYGVIRGAVADRLCAPLNRDIFFRWDRQKENAAPVTLHAYLIPSLTLAHEEWEDLEKNPKAQQPCYAALLFLEQESFHVLCSAMLEWLMEAGAGNWEDGQYINRRALEAVLHSLSSTDENPTPLPLQAIREFLRSQVTFVIHDKPMERADGREDGVIEHAVYFPMVPWLRIETNLNREGFKPISYAFSEYNEVSTEKLKDLRRYFDQLAVLAREEGRKTSENSDGEAAFSIAEWVFTDYFLLLSRQLLQYTLESLDEYEYLICKDDTPEQIIEGMNALRGPGTFSDYTLYDLFVSNVEHSLSPGRQMKICGVSYQTQALASFHSVAGFPLFGEAVDPLQMAAMPDNKNNLGLLSKDAKIRFTDGDEYLVQYGDSLATISAKLGKDLETLAKQSNLLVCEGLIRACAQVVIPPFSYTTKAEDTLKQIADRYGVSMEHLADGPEAAKNGKLPGLFSMEKKGSLLFPAVGQMEAQALYRQAVRSENLEQLAAMATRYSLHGLRLETDGINPLKPGMWVNEKGALPPAAGLFALTGQQFAIPSQIRSGEVYSITFTKPEELSWLIFEGEKTCFTISIRSGDADAKRIEELAACWHEEPLRHKLSWHGMRDMLRSVPLAYAFTVSRQLNREGGMPLPCKSENGPLSQMKLWRFPDALTQLAASPGRKRPLRASMLLGRYQEADKTMSYEPLACFGLAAAILFSVKKTAGEGCFMYEISGGKASDILVLERMLAAQVSSGPGCFSLDIGYLAPQGGMMFDRMEGLEIAFVQANLSTDTHPSDQIKSQENSDSIRLLWEALITNQGGFYLYYCTNNDGVYQGLPESIFDEKGQASVSLLVVFGQAETGSGVTITNYMNTLITSGVSEDALLTPCAQAYPELLDDIPLDGTSSIRELCCAYDSSLADFAEKNSGLQLREGSAVKVKNGVYLVDSGKAPGGELVQIAAYFGVTTDEIKTANPNRDRWPGTLANGEALLLPSVTVTAGEGGYTTLSQIARKYGCSSDTLAAFNQDTKELFETGQSVRLLCGCSKATSTVSPGVASDTFTVELPDSASEAVLRDNPGMEARDTLMSLYTLLGYQVIGNCDYIRSGMALPAGPRECDGISQYSVAIPLYKIRKGRKNGDAGLPPEAHSPYGGVGTLLQVNYQWQDLYGNLMDSQFSRHESTEDGFVNQQPVFQGYTDELIPVSAWPCLKASYRLEKGEKEGRYVEILFKFDSSKYKEYPTPLALRQAAGLDRKAYESLFFQLTDPLGVDLTVRMSLFPSDDIGDGLKEILLEWLFYGPASVYRYLTALEKGESAISPEVKCSYRYAFHWTAVNQEELFELTCCLGLFRRKKLAAGGFASLEHLFSMEYNLPPDLGKEGNLSYFAGNLESVLREPGICRLRLAAGLNRNSPAAGKESLWIVRQGEQKGGGIWFEFQKNRALLMALRPVSNRLEGKHAPIEFPVYETGRAIEEKGPVQSRRFQGIDLDLWMKTFVEAVDGMFSEETAMAVTRIDRILGSHSYDILLSQKKELAFRLKDYLVPMLKKDQGRTLDKAREALRQQLLVKLSNLYEIQGAVASPAEVSCSLAAGGEDEVQLYGTMEIAEGSHTAGVSVSTAKLPLQSGVQSLTCFIKSPDLVRDESGSILPGASLKLAFTGMNLEHQFACLEGIAGYKSSSWLNFVTKAGEDDLFRKETEAFNIPFLLRSYPEIPKLGEQSCLFTKETPGRLNLNWSYRFGIERSCYYPQDKVEVKVHFNRKNGVENTLRDDSLFDSLAAFTSLYPRIREDLDQYACRVRPDMKAADPEVVNGDAAIRSFLSLSGQVARCKAAGWQLADQVCAQAVTYSFVIGEEVKEIEGVQALVVCVDGEPPDGLPWPSISLGSTRYQSNLWKKEGQRVWYWFTDEATQMPLEAASGQMLPVRQLTFDELYLLSRQSVTAEVCIRRNKQAVGDSEVEDCFIYQTGEVGFSDNLYPCCDMSEPVDLMAYSDPARKTKKLNEHLTAFFGQMLKENPSPVTLMLEVKYNYQPVRNGCFVELPVFLQPAVRLSNSQLAVSIARWSQVLETWRDTHITAKSERTWNEDAVLSLDLTILSDMTEKPMPLLHLRQVQLKGKDILF